MPSHRLAVRGRSVFPPTPTTNGTATYLHAVARIVAVVGLLALAATEHYAPAGASSPAARAAQAPGAAPPPTSASPVVGAATDPATGGYWLVAADGGGVQLRRALLRFGRREPPAPIVGMAATPDGGGYWLVAADGGVFCYGDARFFGSTGGTPLTHPSWAWRPTRPPAATGWWPPTAGSSASAPPSSARPGGRPSTAPVVGMAATGEGGGYWLVAADGGVFTFGDATFSGFDRRPPARPPGRGHGGRPGHRRLLAGGRRRRACSPSAPRSWLDRGPALNRAVVAMAPTADGAGYRLAGADGGVYAFGDAALLGIRRRPPAGRSDGGHRSRPRRGKRRQPRVIDQPIDGGGFTEPCDTAGTSDRRRLPRARLQLRRGHPGRGPARGRGGDGGAHPHHRHRGRAVRQRPGGHRQRRPRRRGHLDPRRRRARRTGGASPSSNPAPVVSSISNNTRHRRRPRPSWGRRAQRLRRSHRRAALGLRRPGRDRRPRQSRADSTCRTVPKVLIECANMRNATDAALLEIPPGARRRPRASPTGSRPTW